MKKITNSFYPNKIICLTEESVEILYLLGREDLIAGVSSFVKRPKEAMKLPKVSLFTSSNYKKILNLGPDLILGHSDIQKDIARDLIEKGQDVFIANHRSVNGILNYVRLISRIVGEQSKGELLVKRLVGQIELAKKKSGEFKRKPKVYFEEWDEPLISSIEWVSEVIELCGGHNIFKHLSKGILAKERFVTHEEIIKCNPDFIFLCWCGKKANIKKVKNRAGYSKISAIKANRVYELKPDVFLQPGPAPILEGIETLLDYFQQFNEEDL